MWEGRTYCVRPSLPAGPSRLVAARPVAVPACAPARSRRPGSGSAARGPRSVILGWSAETDRCGRAQYRTKETQVFQPNIWRGQGKRTYASIGTH